MKELISLQQAQMLMLGILVAAPILGLIIGLITRRRRLWLILGVIIGVGNYALWTVYNAITNSLGLDTVKNLFVNLALFVAIGIASGLIAARYGAKGKTEEKP
jgi:hypothetical protein